MTSGNYHQIGKVVTEQNIYISSRFFPDISVRLITV